MTTQNYVNTTQRHLRIALDAIAKGEYLQADRALLNARATVALGPDDKATRELMGTIQEARIALMPNHGPACDAIDRALEELGA